MLAYESVFFQLDDYHHDWTKRDEPQTIALDKREDGAREILRQIEREFRLLYGALDGSVASSADYEASGQ